VLIVVSDTSPLRALAHLGKVALLEELFELIIVPPAVAAELLHPPRRFVPIDVSAIAFLEVRAPTRSASLGAVRLAPPRAASRVTRSNSISPLPTSPALRAGRRSSITRVLNGDGEAMCATTRSASRSSWSRAMMRVVAFRAS